MGAAAGYEPGKVRLFAQSLAATGFRGRLVLFVYRTQVAAVRELLRTCAPTLDAELVVIRGIREHAKFVRSCIKRLFALMPAESVPSLKRGMLRFHGMPHVTRYFHYADYLAGHDGFSQVLLSDVRDVVFQADPFAGWSRGLYVGMENPALTIATEPFDRDWVLDAYGEAMLARLGDRQVSCSGVTFGDAESVKRYIDRILEEALRLPFSKMKTRIYDQAFHNKLLHEGELGDVHLCQPLRSPIATLGCFDPAAFTVADGLLLNEDGRPAAIVHQYDRHSVLVQAFEKRMPA
jgi:hypothetical protein